MVAKLNLYSVQSRDSEVEIALISQRAIVPQYTLYHVRSIDRDTIEKNATLVNSDAKTPDDRTPPEL
jgi:hypothetical protein